MNDEQEVIERINVGDNLPAFEIKLNDGTLVNNASLRGKISVLVFFNTSCKDCQAELPEIQKLINLTSYENDNDRSALPLRSTQGGQKNDDASKSPAQAEDDIVVIAISRAEGETSVAQYWQEHSFTIPYSAQDDRRIYELFATSIIPRIYIADKSGKVIATFNDQNAPTAEQLLTIVNNAN